MGKQWLIVKGSIEKDALNQLSLCMEYPFQHFYNTTVHAFP